MELIRTVRPVAAVACILFFLYATAVCAENRTGALTVSPFFGRVLFDNDLDYNNDTIVGLGLGYHLSRNFAAELSYGRIDSTRDTPAGRVDGPVDLYRLEGLYHLDGLSPCGKTVPYLAAGLGMMSFDSRPRGSGRDNDFALDYGIGLKYFVNPDVAFRADVRHVMNFRGEGDTSNHNLLYTFGLALLFGGEKKAVEPGAASVLPAPVPAPPADSDSDGDGVPDSRDACPDTPRGVAVDPDGCPVDSDGDGVPDYHDRCPGTPAGTKVDTRGCPVPTQAEITERGTYSFKSIYFDTGKSAIKPESHPVLDGVARYMTEYPDIRLEVQGHTDNVGPEELNQRLSEARANAVRSYLIAAGVAGDRLTVRGYGMSIPVASNDTVQGRAKNRRIEFEPIE